MKKGKTQVLSAEEARALLDSIDISTQIGLRDRALIATMLFTFGRVGAVTKMKVDVEVAVEDVYVQGRRIWRNLHEKGRKLHSMPAHHLLDEYLQAYLDGAGLADDKKGSLFTPRFADRGSFRIDRSGRPMSSG